MASVKRTSGSFAASAAKKSRTSKLVPTVIDAFAHSETLPANLRTLLKTSLEIVLNADKVDRHAYEVEVVDQAQRALELVQAAIQQEHKVALGKQNEVISPAETAKREAAKKAAEAHLDALKNKLEAEKATKKEAEKTEEEADGALKAAQKDEKAAQKDLAKATEKQATMSTALSDDFVTAQGTGSGADNNKAVHKLQGLGKEYGLDSTLLSTLPIASKKQPESRTDFENMVFSQLQALITAQIGNLSQTVGEAENVAAGKAATTAAASAALEQAKAALKAAEDAVEATHAAHKEAGKDVAKADKHLRQIWEDMMHVCDAQDKIANQLKHFNDNVWTAFNALKEKDSVAEAAAAAAAAAEAAAAKAAEEEAAKAAKAAAKAAKEEAAAAKAAEEAAAKAEAKAAKEAAKAAAAAAKEAAAAPAPAPAAEAAAPAEAVAMTQ